jgi:hypothetical protein
MKYAGLKKFRWAFFVFAVLGIADTPIEISRAASHASADHRLIFPFLGAFLIRFLVIGFFLKIWWDTRKRSETAEPERKA